MDENKRLERIESKLDKVLEEHGNRLTKIETQAGFIKAGLGFLSGVFLWILNRLSTHQ